MGGEVASYGSGYYDDDYGYAGGSTWYIQAYSGGDVAYVITNPPVGY